MKKMIKNLMLVAVAAIAFIACSQEGNEVNVLSKGGTTYEFTAEINEETRSSFGEKVDGAYPSFWSGYENISFYATDNYGYVDSMTISDDKKLASFTVVFDTELNAGDIIYAYSGDSWTGDEAADKTVSIANSQKSTETSVNDSNHYLFAEYTVGEEGVTAPISLSFKHGAAYGKMQLTQFNGSEISEVKITIDENTYTVEPQSLENPTIWFACYEDTNIETFSVEAKVNGFKYGKTIDMASKANPLTFTTGTVSSFKVEGLEEVPADYNVVLTKVTKIDGNTISFAGEDSNDKLTLVINPGLETIVAGTYTGVDATTYGPGFSSDSALEYDYNSSTFNISAAYNESYDFYLSGNPIVITDLGDNNFSITTTTSTWIPVDKANKTVKITFEGTIALPDSFTYLGRYYDLDSNPSTSGGSYMYKVVADGVEYSLELYWTYANEDGAIKVGTYNYCYNTPDAMYSDWNGFSIISDSYYYGSTLEATADGVVTLTLKDVDGNLIGEYVYEGVATFGDEETPEQPGEGGGEEPNPSDPNKFADYMATNIAWNQSNTCFDISVDGVDGAKIQVNAANRANNNSLTLGDYSYGTGEMQFRFASSGWSYSDYQNISMNVSIVDGQYRILITVGSDTWSSNFEGSIGYLGMPEDWEAPEFGGEEPGEGGGDEPETPVIGTIDNPYIYTSCNVITSSGYYLYVFTGSDAYQLNLESNLQSPATSFPVIGTGGFGNAESEYYFAGTSYKGGALDNKKTTITTEDLGDGKYRFTFVLALQDGNTHYAKYEGTLSAL